MHVVEPEGPVAHRNAPLTSSGSAALAAALPAPSRTPSAGGESTVSHRTRKRRGACQDCRRQGGYAYLHFGGRRVTERPAPRRCPTSGPWPRSGASSVPRVWFAAHVIARFTRIVTDNGSCYRAKDFTRAVCSFTSRHQRNRPYPPPGEPPAPRVATDVTKRHEQRHLYRLFPIEGGWVTARAER